jgi:hypothetical protein
MSMSHGGIQLGFEQIPEGEDEAILKIIEVERQLLQLRVDHEHLPGPGRSVPRGQHPKHHGCVRAEFVIADDIPADLRFGVFREPGKRFPAWIRYSNARVQDDQHPGGHGMAIKLMDVPGEKLLEGEEHEQTQDFILLDSPVFFIKNAIEYAEFDAALLRMQGTDSWLGKISLAAYFLKHPGELLILRKIESNISSNPLETQYWSTTPYKLGAGAVKYFASPRLGGEPITALSPSPDQLREALRRNLQTRDATFDFFVQSQVDPVRTPIEDPTHVWDEGLAPNQKVATILIPCQTFESDEQMEFCQNLSFNPWRSLPDHKPLGGINRVRKSVYVNLSDMRHELNNATHREPTPDTSPTG